MKVKQQTLKGFECEIDDAQAFKKYYTKNAPLMQGHLLILKGSVDADVKNFLDERNVAYVNANETSILTRKKRSTAVLQVPEEENEVVSLDKTVEKETMVFNRTIRSGEAIETNNDLVIFGRINSGALIQSKSSVQVFGIIDGIIKCDGQFLLLKEIGKGSVTFHGEELDVSQFNGTLKLIQYSNNAIMIKDVE